MKVWAGTLATHGTLDRSGPVCLVTVSTVIEIGYASFGQINSDEFLSNCFKSGDLSPMEWVGMLFSDWN